MRQNLTEGRREKHIKCPICKKKFMPASMHAYHISNPNTHWKRLVCSYHCVRAWERKQDAKPEAIRRKALIEKELAGGFGGCVMRKKA